MGGKMRSNVKTLVVLTVLLVIVLSFLVMAKYFNAGVALTIKGGELAVTAPNLVHLSKYLNGCRYQLDIRNTFVVPFVFLLLLWRITLIRRKYI